MIASVKADVKDISAAETTGLNVWMSADTPRPPSPHQRLRWRQAHRRRLGQLACVVDGVVTTVERGW